MWFCNVFIHNFYILTPRGPLDYLVPGENSPSLSSGLVLHYISFKSMKNRMQQKCKSKLYTISKYGNFNILQSYDSIADRMIE